MIEKETIAEAIRNMDAVAEEHQDFGKHLRMLGIDPDDLLYVANQRALRLILIDKGVNPNRPHRSVKLTMEESRRQNRYALAFIDGFVTRDGITNE
jgi:hypothetical protein